MPEPLTDAELTTLREILPVWPALQAMLAEWQAGKDAQAQSLVDTNQTSAGQLRGMVERGEISAEKLTAVNAVLQPAAVAESLKVG